MAPKSHLFLEYLQREFTFTLKDSEADQSRPIVRSSGANTSLFFNEAVQYKVLFQNANGVTPLSPISHNNTGKCFGEYCNIESLMP